MLKMVYFGFLLVFFFNVGDQVLRAQDTQPADKVSRQVDSLKTEKEKLIKKAYKELGIFEKEIEKLQEIEKVKKQVARHKKMVAQAYADKKAYNDRIRKIVSKYTAEEAYSGALQRELNKVMK